MVRDRHERAARILDALARHGGWMYGLDISKAADLPDGGIYPELARLVRTGWIERRWVAGATPTGRPRRQYRVKPRR